MKHRNLFILLCLIPLAMIGQSNWEQQLELYDNNGELYFTISADELEVSDFLLSKVSIVGQSEDSRINAYSTKKHLQSWLSTKPTSSIKLQSHPGILHQPKMKSTINQKDPNDWDYYPTYDAYLDLMNQFQTNYPDLCRVESIGQSEEGREIMMVVISDNIGEQEGEAQVLYTSSIHGDELAGYVLFLRLIDYLLSNYGTNDKVTNMVNNLEIWINPLANPDGAYASGNSTVFGATRFNSNGVDLNRNYPDPEDGEHPDGHDWQAETMVFMQLAESQHFTLSLNCHGGNEVFNYPWDTWPKLHADDTWWYFVGREWADTVHAYAPQDYFDGFDNGVTNGYQWYSISGGRQDYMNYFHHCREVTLEISNTKLLPENQLEDFWEYNHRSFLNYIEQTSYGIQGLVTESGTSSPLKASVFIENHDEDESWVVSNELGYYYRPVFNGNYDISFFRPGYELLTITDVEVSNYSNTILDVELVPSSSFVPKNNFEELFGLTQQRNEINLIYFGTDPKAGEVSIINTQGQVIMIRKVSFLNKNEVFDLSMHDLPTGLYFLNVNMRDMAGSIKFIKK